MTNTKLILASNSPRRQELLGLLGLPFTVRVRTVAEEALANESPLEMVERLARAKAAVIPLSTGEIAIAADTIVVLEGEVLGKPADAEEARRMLQALRGRTHQVHTATALHRGEELWSEVVTSHVHMRPYTAAEIVAYVASGDPLDKAGAYAIQNPRFDPVEEVEGCALSVMGLPLCHLRRALIRWDVPVPWPTDDYCQTVLNRPCTVAWH